MDTIVNKLKKKISESGGDTTGIQTISEAIEKMEIGGGSGGSVDILRNEPKWDSNETYMGGDYVWHNGVLYMSAYDGNTEEPTLDIEDEYDCAWYPTKIADLAHRTDIVGELTYCPEWDSTASYVIGDLVWRNEHVYRANSPNCGVDPSSYSGNNDPWDSFLLTTLSKVGEDCFNRIVGLEEVESTSVEVGANLIPGTYVQYQGHIYVWNGLDFLGSRVTNMIDEIKNMIAPEYYPGSTYNKNDLVRFNRGLWKSVSDNNSYSPNTQISNKWRRTTIAEILSSLIPT